MNKNLQPQEVIDSLSRKVELIIQLRDAKKEHNADAVEVLSKKIIKIETKLTSSPLQKT